MMPFPQIMMPFPQIMMPFPQICFVSVWVMAHDVWNGCMASSLVEDNEAHQALVSLGLSHTISSNKTFNLMSKQTLWFISFCLKLSIFTQLLSMGAFQLDAC